MGIVYLSRHLCVFLKYSTVIWHVAMVRASTWWIRYAILHYAVQTDVAVVLVCRCIPLDTLLHPCLLLARLQSMLFFGSIHNVLRSAGTEFMKIALVSFDGNSHRILGSS